MRLSIHSCLILLLCFFVSPAFAVSGSGGGSTDIPSGWTHYYKFSGSCGSFSGCTEDDIAQYQGYYTDRLAQCQQDHPGMECAGGWSVDGASKRKHVAVYYRDYPTCDNGQYNPGSGQCESEPDECLEIGEFYNPRTRQCVTECPSGRLDNQCLAEPETECDESSADYQGTVGWGDNHRPVCGGDNQCQDNETYAFRENDEGSWSGQCINNDSNPPVCPKGFEGALIITDGGFACEGLNPDPDNPDDPNDTSDGDSDGDGEGDTTGITEQLQDIKNLLSGGNTERTNVKNKLEGIGQSIEDSAKSITDAIENIPGGGGDGGNDGDDGDGEDDDNPDPVTWEGEPIDTELTDPSDEYDQAMSDYQAKLNQIKGEVKAMFSTNLSGGGSVDDNTKTIMGVDVNFSLNRFLAGLDILGAIVLFCAAFISAGILFTGRG